MKVKSSTQLNCYCFVHTEECKSYYVPYQNQIYINVTGVHIFGDKTVIYKYNFALQFSEFFHYDARIPCSTLVSLLRTR